MTEKKNHFSFREALIEIGSAAGLASFAIIKADRDDTLAFLVFAIFSFYLIFGSLFKLIRSKKK